MDIESNDQKFSRVENQSSDARRSFLKYAALGSLASIASTPAASLEVSNNFLAAGSAVFNVIDFGAVGDGVSDDTIHIQNTINAAQSAGGGIVLFPAGVYLVNGAISIQNIAVTLQGVGPSSSIIQVPGGSNIDTITVTNVTGFTIKSMHIRSGTQRVSGRSIFLVNTQQALIEQVDMTHQCICCEISGGNTHAMRLCFWQMSNRTGVGLRVAGSMSNDTKVEHVYVVNAQIGFNILNTGAIIMHTCECILCNNGILINPGDNQSVYWSFFTNCAFDSSYDHTMWITTSGNGIVSGLTFVNCWSATSQIGNTCVVSGNVNGVDFIGHRFLNSALGSGLYLMGPAKNVHVDSCVAGGNINGHGFCAVNNASHFAIRNCHSGDYGVLNYNKWGVYITNGCSDYIVTGCHLSGNSVASIVDSGISPKLVNNNLV